MNQPGTLYKHSGKINCRNTAIALLLLLLSSVLGGYIYSWVLVKYPYDPLNGIFGLFFAAWQACVCSLVIMVAQSRSKIFGIIFGFCSSICGLYYAWLFWVSRLHPSKDYYFYPTLLWEKIQETYGYGVNIYIMTSRVYDKGWLRVEHFEMNLGLEAFAVTLICILAGYYSVKDHYYCEECQAWCNENLNIGKLKTIPDENLTRQALEQGNIDPLLDLTFSEELLSSDKPEKDKPFFSTRVSLSACPQCKNSNVINVIGEKFYCTKNSRYYTDDTEIIPPVYLSRQNYNTLLDYFTKLKNNAASD